jgi:Zn-dependent M16 (insulinase) family peptidase
VYKTVPGLYKNELERRKKYSLSTVNKAAEKKTDEPMECEDSLTDAEYYFAPEELISISLEYIEEKYVNTIKFFSYCIYMRQFRGECRLYFANSKSSLIVYSACMDSSGCDI